MESFRALRSHAGGIHGQSNTVYNKHIVKLKRLLNRFRKAELLTEVPDVCKLSVSSFVTTKYMDKDQIIERLVLLIQEKTEDLEDIIPLVQLRFIQIHAKSKVWKVVEVENASRLFSEKVERQRFAETLENFLNRSHFFCKVVCSLRQDVLWTIVIFEQPNVVNDVYLIHCFTSPIVLYCAVKAAQKDVLFRALIQLYKGTGMRNFNIKANDFHSLLRMCIQTSMEDFNPAAFPSVVQKHLAKRKDEPIEKLPSNVKDEDLRDLMFRKNYLKTQFNSYELPRLETLTYMTKTEYFGIPDEEEMIDKSMCSVFFKGKHVLEGLHKMVQMREAGCPLPDILSKVPNSACNSFLVMTKPRQNGENSSTLD